LAKAFPEIVTRLARAAADEGGKAHLVAGAVRDSLLGLPTKDWDFEIFGVKADRLDPILRSLKPLWIDTVGASFGVLKAKFGALEIDVSIPRIDSKAGQGHRGFEVTGDPWMSPKEAARRRDFTVNAIAMDPLTSETFDFFDGIGDLKRKVLRAIDPVLFCDDPLRVLRAAQFAARFNFSVDPSTAALCREMCGEPEFANLPSARIGQEWRKLLLKSLRPSVGLRVGLEIGAWQVLHPELAALVGIPQDPGWHPEGDVWTHNNMVVDAAADIVRREQLDGDEALLVMAGALCHDLGKPATTEFIDGHWRSPGHEREGIAPTHSFLSRMDFGERIKAKVARIVNDHLFAAVQDGKSRDAAVRRLSKRLDPATIRELVLVAEADHQGRDSPLDGFPAGVALLAQAEGLSVRQAPSQPILLGRHLVENLGWKPGTQFSPVLAIVEEAQIEGTVTTLEEALEMARSLGDTPGET
jgi:tRNA nucleotidyltransferase (CCA-adding enzyme)